MIDRRAIALALLPLAACHGRVADVTVDADEAAANATAAKTLADLAAAEDAARAPLPRAVRPAPAKPVEPSAPATPASEGPAAVEDAGDETPTQP